MKAFGYFFLHINIVELISLCISNETENIKKNLPWKMHELKLKWIVYLAVMAEVYFCQGQE